MGAWAPTRGKKDKETGGANGRDRLKPKNVAKGKGEAVKREEVALSTLGRRGRSRRWGRINVV